MDEYDSMIARANKSLRKGISIRN
jgi:hypothetical protein